MSIETTPDTYLPSIDEFGNYIDIITGLLYPLQCACTGKQYCHKQSMSTHCKTVVHIKWLNVINNNKRNYLQENVGLKQLVDNQKKIIAQLDQKNMILLKQVNAFTLCTKIIQNSSTNKSSDLIDLID